MFHLTERWCKILFHLEISFTHLVLVAADDSWLVHNTLLLLDIFFLLQFSIALFDLFLRFLDIVSVVAHQGRQKFDLTSDKFARLCKSRSLNSIFMCLLAMSVVFSLFFHAVRLVSIEIVKIKIVHFISIRVAF